MIVGYIKKQNKPINLIGKIKYFFGVVNVTQVNMGYILEVPIKKNEDKIIKKASDKIRKLEIDHIVFSNELVYTEFSRRVIKSMDKVIVCNGKNLMQYMQYQILEYILKIQKIEPSKVDVFFLIKKDESLNLKFLSRFIKNCKTVNIVTNDINRFKLLQDNVYEKENILIGVSNNKNKGLKRAKYIFNVNMNENDIKKYKINRDTIIVNIKNSIYYNMPGFNGINVNYFKLFLEDAYMEQFENINEKNEFDVASLYKIILEKSVVIEKRKLNILNTKKEDCIEENLIRKNGVKILKLVGNNGEIGEREIEKNYMPNTLTK